MAFPTTSRLDDFNRANDTASLGANWTSPLESGFSSLGIISNQAYAAADFKDDYWNTSYAADQETWVTLPALVGAGGPSQLWARVQNPGGGSLNGYWLQVLSTGGWTLGKTVAGAITTLGSGGGAGGVAAGDKIGLECIGTAISGYRYRAGAWSLLETVADSAVSGTGYIGLQVRGDATAVARFDDFSGGNLVQQVITPLAAHISYVGA